ncbi:DUF2989 domain-containing protein [Celerinatantimonas sp. YJH-8]|uniref:DUF2989 domain-containing protein n=1 Tax=Celerinatantimonas sp. YJH-8 TaxID=3228714 RepID=UPI0038C27C2D
MSKYLTGIIAIIITLQISGCDDFNRPQKSARSICADNPSLCDDLNKGGWCNDPREALIQARWQDAQQTTDRNNYLLLDSLNKYQRCIAVITQIEPIKLKERKTERTETLLTINNQIKTLESQVATKQDPYSLYYRWSQMSDYTARQQFINEQNKASMQQDPLLLWALATIYNQSDPQKSLSLMQQALMRYSQQKLLPVGLLESIVTQYMRLNRYDQAYIWSLVAEQLSNVQVNMNQLDAYQKFEDSQVSQFKDQAKLIIKSIKKGVYHP